MIDNLTHAADLLAGEVPDFMLLQELDVDATRSWHVDEPALIEPMLGDYRACFALNYDSPFLLYPFNQPHGALKAGLLTLSGRAVSRFARRSLPVETGFTKFLDLDRCYTKTWVDTGDDKRLCLYNLHLSAYTSDGTIANEQLALLAADMLGEAAAGNYVVGGGDFNKDLLGDSSAIFGVSGQDFAWAQPLPEGAIPEGLALVSSLDADDPVPSCRNADSAYQPGRSFVLTVDGFIVSDNVRVIDCHVIDDGFAVSDHNPVKLTFELME